MEGSEKSRRPGRQLPGLKRFDWFAGWVTNLTDLPCP
jgi:hypothetical protein